MQDNLDTNLLGTSPPAMQPSAWIAAQLDMQGMRPKRRAVDAADTPATIKRSPSADAI